MDITRECPITKVEHTMSLPINNEMLWAMSLPKNNSRKVLSHLSDEEYNFLMYGTFHDPDPIRI